MNKNKITKDTMTNNAESGTLIISLYIKKAAKNPDNAEKSQNKGILNPTIAKDIITRISKIVSVDRNSCVCGFVNANVIVTQLQDGLTVIGPGLSFPARILLNPNATVALTAPFSCLTSI